MVTKPLATMIAWAVLAALTACVDGGPPNPFRRPSTRNAPFTAADGGQPDTASSDEDDAGANTDRGDETSER